MAKNITISSTGSKTVELDIKVGGLSTIQVPIESTESIVLNDVNLFVDKNESMTVEFDDKDELLFPSYETFMIPLFLQHPTSLSIYKADWLKIGSQWVLQTPQAFGSFSSYEVFQIGVGYDYNTSINSGLNYNVGIIAEYTSANRAYLKIFDAGGNIIEDRINMTITYSETSSTNMIFDYNLDNMYYLDRGALKRWQYSNDAQVAVKVISSVDYDDNSFSVMSWLPNKDSETLVGHSVRQGTGTSYTSYNNLSQTERTIAFTGTVSGVSEIVIEGNIYHAIASDTEIVFLDQNADRDISVEEVIDLGFTLVQVTGSNFDNSITAIAENTMIMRLSSGSWGAYDMSLVTPPTLSKTYDVSVLTAWSAKKVFNAYTGFDNRTGPIDINIDGVEIT